MTVDTVSNNDYLKKLHNEILIIMDEIDRICKLRGLRYYLASGSCLGALRHKGFIPWDDDLDIIMPFEDFQHLIDILNKDLSNEFYLKWITTDKNYYHDYAKVCLKNTQFIEDECDQGIFVDIFPLYPSAKYSFMILLKKKIYDVLRAALFCKSKKTLSWKPRNGLIYILSRTLNSPTIYKLLLYVIHPLKEKEAKYYACYPSTYPINRQITPIDWYRECISMPFEDRSYLCAIDSDKKMQFEYGKEYMELPPIEKRKSHYPLFVKFCDGSTFWFSKITNKVTYEEILK